MNNFAAIILAAGYSSRMGQFKPLLSIGDETVTDHVISIFRQNRVEAFLVTGWKHEELVAGIKSKDTQVIYNPEYSRGMFTSVRAGIRALPANIEAFFMMPVDIPLVKSSTVVGMLDEAMFNSGRIIYPVYQGKRGHPPLIPASLIPTILAWEKEGGLKAALASQGVLALDLDVDDPGILIDMDTMEEYKEVLNSKL